MVEGEPVLRRNVPAFSVSEGAGHLSKISVLDNAKLQTHTIPHLEVKNLVDRLLVAARQLVEHTMNRNSCPLRSAFAENREVNRSPWN